LNRRFDCEKPGVSVPTIAALGGTVFTISIPAIPAPVQIPTTTLQFPPAPTPPVPPPTTTVVITPDLALALSRNTPTDGFSETVTLRSSSRLVVALNATQDSATSGSLRMGSATSTDNTAGTELTAPEYHSIPEREVARSEGSDANAVALQQLLHSVMSLSDGVIRSLPLSFFQPTPSTTDMRTRPVLEAVTKGSGGKLTVGFKPDDYKKLFA
jgi:hypothetical protein